MRSISEISDLLNELEHIPANELEDHDLDFKEWNPRSMKDSIDLVVEMAICMANGGGTVVFGVNDKAVGRSQVILGVPPEVDINRLKKMESDTRYTDRADGSDALPVALYRLMDRINADNPITTLEHGMFHFEYRTYPEIAL